MIDRISTVGYENRYKITDEVGVESYVNIERADEPTQEGTPLTAENLLNGVGNSVITALGLAETATIADALTALINNIEVNAVDGYAKIGNVAFCWGGAQVTPSSANTPTAEVVTLPIKYVGSYNVIATPATSVPGTQITGVGVSATSSTTFTVYLTRTNTISTGVNWFTVGVVS